MSITPNFDFTFKNMQFPNQNFGNFNQFGSFNQFGNFSQPFKLDFSSLGGGSTVSSSSSSSSSNIKSDYDAWYEETMGYSSTGNTEVDEKNNAFLEEKSVQTSNLRTLIDEQDKKIEKLKSMKSDSKIVIDSKMLQDVQLDKDGNIKEADDSAKDEGIFETALNWVGSAGSAVFNMGKSLAGYDENGWNSKKCLNNVGTAAALFGASCIPVLGPIITLGMVGYGVYSGVKGAAQGARELDYAVDEREKENARQNICAGVITGALSLFGLRSIGKAATSAGSTTATTAKSGILSRVGNEIKNVTTNPLKATYQAIKSDVHSFKTNGFFKTLGNKTANLFKSTDYEADYINKYGKMESDLNAQITDLNSKIASETNAVKKVLLEERKSMLENNLHEVQNLSNLKTKFEYDKLKTVNSSTKNNEALSNYTRNGNSYEINGQSVSRSDFDAFRVEIENTQKIYNKNLKDLIKSKEYAVKQMAKNPDAHRTELDDYTQSSIRAKYKTKSALKAGIKDLNTRITDINAKIAEKEEILKTFTNQSKIAGLKRYIDTLKASKATLENELAVCNNMKIRSFASPYTWFQKNEYLLGLGESNANMKAFWSLAGNTAKNPVTISLVAKSQWDKEESVPFTSTSLKELTPDELDEMITNLEAQRDKMKEQCEIYDNVNSASDWENLKAQAAAEIEKAEEEQTSGEEQISEEEQKSEDEKADSDEDGNE